MKREEYEHRKRRLEEQLQEGIELLKAGFRQQLRALELVWMTTAEEDTILPRAAAEGMSREEPAVPAEASATPQPEIPSRPRRGRGQLWKDIDAALDQLPQVFSRHDVVKALGYEPDRTALHRVMHGLLKQGVIVLKARSVGRYPADYEFVEKEEEGEEEDAEGSGDGPLPAS